MSDRRRSQVVDQMAASLILQAFLAARTSGGDVKS
jgi:RNase H-fold protein (predicted Holliday junction resolvase)